MADPVPVIGDLLQVTFQSRLYNQVLINTFHYRIEGTGGRTSIFTIQSDLKGFIAGAGSLMESFLDASPRQLTLENIWVQRIAGARVRKSVFEVELAGTSDMDADTANVAASIERRGDFADKHNVGRLQVCIPTSSDAITQGHTTVALETKLNALAVQLLAGQTGAPGTAIFAPVLVHRSGLAIAFNYITVTQTMFTVRVMRRRTVGVGK